MNQNEFQAHITDAIQGGINTKRLHKASKMAWDDFARAHRDMTFTETEQAAISNEIGAWRRETHKTDLFS